MFHIEVTCRKDGYYPETYIFCPHCGGRSTFYSTSPKVCPHCSKSFPDVRKLKTDIEYRKQWHSGGL